jgi:hypothetical protein
VKRVLATIVALLVGLFTVLLLPKPVHAFGDQGAFDLRPLLAGGSKGPFYASAPGRWAWELISRTSAPARLKPSMVRADDATVTESPVLYWSGTAALSALSTQEISGMRKFFALGGTLIVDDAGPTAEGEASPFMKTAQEEVKRILPESAAIELAPEHVLFRSFYLLKRPVGRVLGKKTVQAIVRGGQAQVLFLSQDVGGALARGPSGIFEQAVLPGGEEQREGAVRMAINLAMYILCSNYKDDQVHAPFLMRRRAVLSEP